MIANEYWQEIRNIARLAIEDIAIGDCDDLSERVWETVDGHSWIVYTANHLDVLAHTDNRDSYVDDIGGDFEGCATFDEITLRFAFYAMLTDVNESVDDAAAEVDWSDAISVAIEDVGTCGFSDFDDFVSDVEIAINDRLESAGCYVGCYVDDSGVERTIVPLGAALEIAEIGDPNWDLITAEVDEDDEIEIAIRWTMPGYLDSGDWNFGSDFSEAFESYLDSWCP